MSRPTLDEDLVSIVCHDLKSPLASVLTGAAYLARVLPPDQAGASARSIVAAIQRSTERMSNLVDDLHLTVMLEAGALELDPLAHDPLPMLRAAVELHAARAEAAGVRLTVRAAPTVPRVTCDRARVLHVLGKLLDNALRVTPRGKAIAIDATRNPQMPGYVVFGVRDGGPGVKDDARESIFDRRANALRSPRDGTGLGLPIARGLIALHGGEIGVTNLPDGGARFWFSLRAQKARG